MKVNNLVAVMVITFFCITSTTTSSFAKELKAKEGSNADLGNLSIVYHKHFPKLEVLQKLYIKARRAKDDEAKDKVKLERSAVTESLKVDVEQFNQTTPLKDKELPFKVVSENLPFDVQSIKIEEVTYKSVLFSIQVKINQDIKKPDGELSQRISIHFVAVDSEDKIIPNTWNWATNHGWIKLKKDTIYDAEGHWNSVRVQNMQDFSTVKIMSKEDYKKMKESQ